MKKNRYVVLELLNGKIHCTELQNKMPNGEHIVFSNSKMSLMVDTEISKNEMEFNLNLMRVLLAKKLREDK